jgi:uncharacterized protein (DUF1778 family)
MTLTSRPHNRPRRLPTIEKTEIIRLSVEGQRAFAEAILDLPEPSAGLKKAAKAHRRLIREVR